eukprot:scaffold15240_cov128-Isochrysis_galbana.AAC.6
MASYLLTSIFNRQRPCSVIERAEAPHSLPGLQSPAMSRERKRNAHDGPYHSQPASPSALHIRRTRTHARTHSLFLSHFLFLSHKPSSPAIARAASATPPAAAPAQGA